MAPSQQPRQGELFPVHGTSRGAGMGNDLPLLERQLRDWQARLARFQAPLFAQASAGAVPAADGPLQANLFGSGAAEDTDAQARGLAPLSLAAQHLQFWRWPAAPQQGAALYFVIDQPPHLGEALLLYVGETGQADRRWKGEHDCKHYLAAYGEALQQVGLAHHLSIRFWVDAPLATRARRALERALIQRWQPPFNKETRGRWATPFTADPD